MGYAGYTPPVAPDPTVAPPIAGAPSGGLVPDASGAYVPGDSGTGELLGVRPGSEMTTAVPGATTPSVTPPTGAPAPVSAADAASISEIALDTSAHRVAPTLGDTFKNAAKSFLGKDGWLQNNQTLAGGAIQGIGMGLSANGQVEGEMAMMRERKSQIDSNYAGVNPGQNYRSLAGGVEGDRYDPRSYGSWEYQYDPTQGRIIKVPAGG